MRRVNRRVLDSIDTCRHVEKVSDSDLLWVVFETCFRLGGIRARPFCILAVAFSHSLTSLAASSLESAVSADLA